MKKVSSGEGEIRTVIRLVEPLRLAPVLPAPPSPDGLTSVMLPLSKRWRDALEALKPDALPQEASARLRLLDQLRSSEVSERGLIEKGSGWYWGWRAWLDHWPRVAGEAGLEASRPDEGSWMERVRRHTTGWDAGEVHHAKALAREDQVPGRLRRAAVGAVSGLTETFAGETWQSGGR